MSILPLVRLPSGTSVELLAREEHSPDGTVLRLALVLERPRVGILRDILHVGLYEAEGTVDSHVHLSLSGDLAVQVEVLALAPEGGGHSGLVIVGAVRLRAAGGGGVIGRRISGTRYDDGELDGRLIVDCFEEEGGCRVV